MVALSRQPRLPEGVTAADHLGRGRLQRLPLPASGRANWPPWPPKPDWTITVCHFPPGTSQSGTKSSTDCSPTSPTNWRGRPLTSHEVVIETASPPPATRAGLRVEAQLDPGDYPTGIAISKDRFAALPLVRHETCGQWNYTLLPQPSAPQALPVGEAHGVSGRRRELLTRLADPRLTGLSSTEFADLCVELAPLQAARSQERCSEQRGGRARRATGNQRAKPLFDDSARLMLTLLYQRQVCSMKLLADMLEVTPTCIGHLVAETRRVLEDHSHQPGYASSRFTTATTLMAFLDTAETPTRTRIMERLSHPRLTGMSRAELDELTRRLGPRQAAQVERASYQRRGADRQPGSRGGVFPQKLGDRERVVVALLYLRKLCTLDVLADAAGRREQVLDRELRPRDPTPAHGRRTSPAPSHHPLPHRPRPACRCRRRSRHTDKLILYGFTSSATSSR